MSFLSEFLDKIKEIDIPVDKILQPLQDSMQSPDRAIFLVIAVMCVCWLVFRRVIDNSREIHFVDTGHSNKIIIIIFLVSLTLSVGWDIASAGSSDVFDFIDRTIISKLREGL